MGCRASTEREPSADIIALPPSQTRSSNNNTPRGPSTLKLIRDSTPGNVVSMTSLDKFDVVTEINTVRKRHGSAVMRWSNAQSKAAEEALTRLLSEAFTLHLKFVLRGHSDHDENLTLSDRARLVETVRSIARQAEMDGLIFAVIEGPKASWERLVAAWYAEESRHDYSTGEVRDDARHFTQLVWNVSDIVGAAFYSTADITIGCCKFYPPLDFTDLRSLDAETVRSNIRPPRAK